MAKSTHVHKFKRHRYKTGNEIFFCSLADCSVKLAIPLALGKRSICWRCNEPFLMDEYSIRLAKPHCSGCHAPKQPKMNESVELEMQVNATVPSLSSFETSIPTPAEQYEEKQLSLSERLTKLTQEIQNSTKEEDI